MEADMGVGTDSALSTLARGDVTVDKLASAPGARAQRRLPPQGRLLLGEQSETSTRG